MKKMFMAVIALMMTTSASAQFYLYCSDGNVIKVDSISMIAPADEPDTPVEPEEPDTPTEPDTPDTPTEPENPSASIAIFSVSPEKQVTFSKGNLQYHPANDEWRFAENQLDYIGDENSNISSSYNGWLDLFGWSANNTTAPFGVSSSESYSAYSGSFVDWGTNKIGSDAPNTWRTLSYAEWSYLLYNRHDANDLFGVAQVNGVNGLVFLPDNWTCPAGITFKSGLHSSDRIDDYAAYQTFTVEQWSKLEAAGAVFLPASGIRSGSSVPYVQSLGRYWSATEYNSYYAGYLCFSSKRAYMEHNYVYLRDSGFSVRLVKDVEDGKMPDSPDTPTEPDNKEDGYECVDLGLSVKWATCNVGASKPEEYGDYFAWGETQPKETYNLSTYKWCNGSYDTQTKYCTMSYCGTVDGKTVLEAADDAATAIWGGAWRMPTKAEQDELRNNCTWEWTSENGVNGYRVTSNKEGYTDKSIFLPAAGFRDDSSLYDAGGDGYYWSCSLNTFEPNGAYILHFNASSMDYWGNYGRTYGRSVRPVCQ